MSTVASAKSGRARWAQLAVALSVLVGACLLGASSAAADPQVVGTGSTFAQPAIEQWASTTASFGLNINYQPSSSVIGLQQFAANQVDFGASEIGYSTNQTGGAVPSEPYQYMPDVSGGIAMAYNLVGENGQRISNLQLSPATILGIFTDHITAWNASQIKADNPSVANNLPSAPINFVFRADACGENYIMSYYFNYIFRSEWAAYVSSVHSSALTAIYPTPQDLFPGWIGQSGSEAAASYVQGHSDSITYVQTSWALEYNLSIASMQNPSGNYVQPNWLDVSYALTSAVLYADLEENLDGVFTNTAPDSYPLSTYSYLITAEGTINPAKGAELSQFIYYLACQGQESAYQLGYAPIPPNLVADDFQAGERLAGHSTPPPLNATCKNPVMDGQLPLIGNPHTVGTSPSHGGSPTGPGATGSGGSNPSGGSTPGAGSARSATTVPASQANLGGVAPQTTTTISGQAAIAAAASPHAKKKSGKAAAGLSTTSTTAYSTNPQDLADAAHKLRADSPTLPMAIGVVLLVLVIVAPGVAAVVIHRRSRRGEPA